ncbi:hypothetical protein Tco_0357438 [Tanacetum coccineum]
MSTYFKNMVGYKHNQLKSKSYDEIQEMFDKEMKRVNTFVDMDTELVKGNEHVEAKGDDDQEEAKMKKHMEIVQDDEVAIDAIPLATKAPVIVEWKIIKERKMGYFQLIRADGSSKRPEEAYEGVLWGYLKVMFEPDIESEVWRSLEGHNVTVWKLFSSSGVHFIQKMNIKFRGGLLGLKDCLELILLSAAYTKVNAADMKVTTAERLQLLEEFLLSEG